MKVLAGPAAANVFSILLLSTLSVLAQSENVHCPQIRLNAPDQLIQPEDKALITMALSGGSVEQSRLSYEWFVSRGKILYGKTKEAVEVLTDEESAGSNIKVAVLVRGIPKECSGWAVTEFAVDSYPIGEPVDQFNDSEANKDRYFLENKLDSYFAAIINSPGYEGLITIEFDSQTGLASKIAYLQRIYRHIALRKFDHARITFALAEHNGETKTALWTLPPMAKMPKYATNYRIVRAENYRNKLNCIFPLD